MSRVPGVPGPVPRARPFTGGHHCQVNCLKEQGGRGERLARAAPNGGHGAFHSQWDSHRGPRIARLPLAKLVLPHET